MIRLQVVPMGPHQVIAWRNLCTCDPRFDGAADIDCPTHGLIATIELERFGGQS